jgi:3-oxoacyl-[acyl-carrier protein] reductase
VAAITGAASGIGRAIALGFAAQGARVVAADINSEGLAEIDGENIATVQTDVTIDTDVQRMFDVGVERFGRVDILFNNAGLAGHTRIEDMKDGEFERYVAIHLFGGLYGLRAGLKLMRAQGYGRIVNMISRGAESQNPGWASYAAAKSGLFALTRVAAAECADVDIRVNAMIPGPTRTNMNVGANLRAGDSLQPPEAVVPSALWLATLPADGPTGKVFWNMKEYPLFGRPEPAHG